MLDIVPGTILLEDPREPVLIIPVEAAGPMEAARFVQGIAILADVQITAGSINPAPEADFDEPEDEIETASTAQPQSEVVEYVRDWMDSGPAINRHLAGGRLCA